MTIAGTLQVNVTAKTEAFESGMRKVRTEVQTTQKAVTSAQAGFQSLSASLIGLTAGVLSVQALSGAMKDVVKVGIEMQNLRQSFAAISGGAQAGNREFQFVVQTANKLGLELQTVAGQYRSLAAATRGTNLEGQATRELFTALANAARAYGLSNEALGRAIQAVQQIASKGKVTMEELRGQLGEALPGAMQIAARAYNTNTKALEDMVSKGLDAVDFWQRFTAQLKVEVPAATAIAGKGFTQLGNEIVILKSRIAESGLLKFLDDTASKLAKLMETSRVAAENTQASIDTVIGRYIKFATEAEKAEIAAAASRPDFLAILTRMAPRMQARAAEEERASARQKEINEQQLSNQAIIRDQTANNKALTETLGAQQKQVDTLNKSSAITSEVYGKINGTLEQQIQFLERRKAITAKSLEDLTTTIVARTERSGAVPADLLAQKTALQQQYAADVAGIASRQKAIQDAEAAIRKAHQESEAARRKAAQEAEEERRKDIQQMEEVARVHAQNIDALRALASRYTEVRAERDADRASILAASLATSQYAKESRDLADAIADVQRIEAQLPALRSAAKSSAAEFEAIQDILPDFEPDIQLTRREQLAQRFEDLKRVTSDPGTLANAQRRMEETLAIEKQAELMEHLNDMAEELTNTFVDMAVTGEINFKRLGESFSRMVLDMVADAIDLKGAISGWLKQGLNAAGGGQGGWFSSLFNTGGGAGTAALQTDISTSMAANPELFAFGGGMAAGGPVMPGRFYTVGERGPETLVAGGAGTIVPNGGQTFNMTVITNDANSFRLNERQIAAQSARMLAHARRNL